MALLDYLAHDPLLLLECSGEFISYRVEEQMDMVTKPIDMEALVSRIQELL
ncbi:hypothetical protein ACWKW4_20235 [Hydrogenophaga borbori]